MPTITFIDPSGGERAVTVSPGKSLMEAAVSNTVRGIEAECGGACACATCHVYIDPAWREATGAPDFMEESMLEFADDVRPESRLACQIKVSDSLDGMVIRVAPQPG